jgi:hypothetical protein
VLGAAETKNRKGATQPLSPDVVEALRGYLEGRPAGAPLWPGNWWKKGADMLRIDLDAAGISYAVEGTDGPLYADFHALRHSYIALLEKSGATLKEAMQLARHSDPKLTMAVYGRAQLHDLGRAVERLPDLMSAPEAKEASALKATGTDSAYRPLTSAVDGGRGSSMEIKTPPGEESQSTTGHNSLAAKEVAAGCDTSMEDDGSSPTRTRTWNKPVNRRLNRLAL